MPSPPVIDDRPLWRVREFARWADIPAHEVYRHVALGRIPGVVRFGRAIRIDPVVALPVLRRGR